MQVHTRIDDARAPFVAGQAHDDELGPSTQARRNTVWGIGDQALSSGTNFLLVVLVARVLQPAAFGAFSIAYFVYLLCLGTSRSLNTDALLIRYSNRGAGVQRAAIRAASGGAAAFSIVGVIVASVSVAALPGPIGATLVLLGLMLPALLVQDAFRYAFFALGRPSRAFANDLVWAVAQVGLIGAVVPLRPTPATFVAAWGGAAVIAAAFALTQLRLLPDPRAARRWWRTHRDLAPFYVLEFWAMRGSSQLVLLLVGALVGVVATGALRGAQALYGPLTILLLGTRLVLVSEGSRRRDRTRTYTRRVSIALTVCALAWTAGLAFVPASIGHAALGATWGSARGVLLPLGFAVAATAAAEGAISGLRILAAARQSMGVQLFTGSLNILAGLVGATIAGASGAASGLAVASWLAVALWWFVFRARAARAHALEGFAVPSPNKGSMANA